MDSDDWWTLDKLLTCYDRIDENVDLIYHDLEIIRDQPVLFGRKFIQCRQLKNPVFMDLLVNGNAINTSSTIVRKDLLRQINYINEDPNLIAVEDYYTWLQIAKKTNQFVYLAQRYGYYLDHNLNTSNKDISIPLRYAVAEFICLLDERQKNKIETMLNYSAGRFNYLSGNYEEAKQKLLHCLRKGKIIIKIKSLFMIVAALENLCG